MSGLAGQVALVTGKMGAWPMGSHWRRWDPTFAGNHAVAVFRIDAGARVWWCDPLAPTGYSGEWMAITELARFTRTLGNRMMVDVMNSRRAPMLGTVTRTPYVGGPARWRVAAGVTINGYVPIRTTNLIERRFREVRRRTRPMGVFSDRTSMERILYAVFAHENLKEKTMTPFLIMTHNS